MRHHLTEMRDFLDLVQAYSYGSSESIEEQKEEVLNESKVDVTDILVEELKDLKENWLSMISDDNDQKVAIGYERGLYKAAEMLEQFVSSKLNRRI
jgi:hypothetical protein